MLTGARLLAAILFGCLGYVAAQEVVTGLAGQRFSAELEYPWFIRSIAIIGVWQGWMVMGRLVGRGYGPAMGAGLRTSVQIAIIGLIYYALRRMFLLAADLRYGGDFGRAIFESMEFFMEFGLELVSVPSAVGILLIGGMVAGLLCELASRYWR